MNIKIPFFDYRKIYELDKKELISKFRNISNSGNFILQNELEKFEKNLAKFHGCNYALGVANATDAMELLLIADNVKYNDEIIFCSHTMVATASAIKFAGAVPVPVNCNKEYLIEPSDIISKINKRTKGIFVTQLNGRIADMKKIKSIANKHNLRIYEDSAQAIGSKYYSQPAGTFGVGGCLSFYPAKVLGCLGDGGAIITNNKSIYEKIKLLRDHGRKNLDVKFWGFNSRLDNIQAGFLNVMLKKLSKRILYRRKLAKIYFQNLKKNSFIKLPPNNLLEKNRFDNYQNFEIQCTNRDRLRIFLAKNGIGTILPWGGKAVHQFKKLKIKHKGLLFTENLMKKSLLVPINHFLSIKEVNYISKKINEFYEK